MLDDLVKSMTDFLVPSKEDISNIEKKFKEHEKLDDYDLLVLAKMRLIRHILNSKGERI